MHKEVDKRTASFYVTCDTTQAVTFLAILTFFFDTSIDKDEPKTTIAVSSHSQPFLSYVPNPSLSNLMNMFRVDVRRRGLFESICSCTMTDEIQLQLVDVISGALLAPSVEESEA